MTVRRLKKAQRGPWCSYCPDKTERAVHRGCGFRKFACSYHLDKLKSDDRKEDTGPDYSDAAFSLPRYI